MRGTSKQSDLHANGYKNESHKTSTTNIPIISSDYALDQQPIVGGKWVDGVRLFRRSKVQRVWSVTGPSYKILINERPPREGLRGVVGPLPR